MTLVQLPSATAKDTPTRRTEPAERSPVMTLLVLIATLGILAYSIFLLNPANRGDLLPYSLVIAAESILAFHAIVSMWTILAAKEDPRTFAVHHARERLYAHTTGDDPTDWPLMLHGRSVTVEVFITAYGEPVETITRTLDAALRMRGRHRTWVLDDGDSDELRDAVAARGARYVRRLSSGGAKAGNINHALSIAKGEYFLVLDADFAPDEEMLERTLPFFVDDKLAFVQTPQSYGNETTSTIAKGATYLQTMFYRFVQPGRNRFNAAFCVGTNVVFRRAAVIDVGGIYTDSKSEDVWTSLMMHENGWRSVFLPEVLAVGDAPESVEAYSKQQLRWATGGFEILFTHPLWSRRSRLTIDQRLQYFVTATFYLTGIAPLLLLLVPPLEVYLDLRPMSLDISAGQWLLFYGGFYVMQIILMWFTLGTFRWETLTLATVSFPIYTKALFNVLRGKDVGWSATGAVQTRSPFNFMVPQMLFFVFLGLTSVLAIWRDWIHGIPSLATGWNLINTVVLGAFMLAAAREDKALRAVRRAERRAARSTGPAHAAPTRRARATAPDLSPEPELVQVAATATDATPWEPSMTALDRGESSAPLPDRPGAARAANRTETLTAVDEDPVVGVQDADDVDHASLAARASANATAAAFVAARSAREGRRGSDVFRTDTSTETRTGVAR
ncbi:glycosyltransferase family 2 protein [Demequina zhanjiangensis]|uniref:Glycosyltransferase n=1 Tax=Demequina zhanjiangensis TaxID=3051659 RepID=A0ABT8FWZ9_9MICO|nr:glycosyltransferase [Demequina sp. SYSU T00b26]MDN4471426.1 glycosyltransferase [Demequina sp. SYSU T00b26]